MSKRLLISLAAVVVAIAVAGGGVGNTPQHPPPPRHDRAVECLAYRQPEQGAATGRDEALHR